MSNSHLSLRSMPIGAELLADGGAHFRVWAPERSTVEVVFDSMQKREVKLAREETGYFSGLISDVGVGSRYKYLLDDQESCPDPASRFQPNGPHSSSAIVDPRQFRWTDNSWRGVGLEGQVIYEMHVGTFTPGGTWASAAEKLPYLRDTGITLIEVMPVADFPGQFGWGYDGVGMYAPVALYGEPDDMRSFVDRAHSLGVAVILDVVYNHLGPDGNYLAKYSPYYFNSAHETDWGAGINFDGNVNQPVREYFRENASYWIREFHLDGLRLDATQDIHDTSKPHILAEVSCAVRAAAGKRSVVLIGENEPQDTSLIRSVEEGGCGLDGLWNDDYHHSAMVALTGHNDAYYTDYKGTAQEFLSAVKHGYLYQGQRYSWQKKRRGKPTFGLPRAAMIQFIQNHDQVANSARGQRISELASPGKLKALTALTLLGPGTPMLFQGQEFGSSNRFLFFADQKPELAKIIREGRAEFLQQWRSLSMPEMSVCLSNPSDRATFETCILDHSEVDKHKETYALHRDLLKLRREDAVISKQASGGLDGAILSPECLVLRYFTPGHAEDRLLLVNLGIDLHLTPAPEPLLAPPLDTEWVKLWSSEDPPYGGCGTPPLDGEDNWHIPGQAAVVLRPQAIHTTS